MIKCYTGKYYIIREELQNHKLESVFHIHIHDTKQKCIGYKSKAIQTFKEIFFLF